MAGLAAQPRNGDHRDSEHLVDDGDPPQIPIMVPTSGGQLGPSTGEAMEEIPAVVSITRVPAKPKQQEVPPGGGLKVRTDLGAPRAGPPPLLRVAGGQPQRPALPPMPRLKLGGQRPPPQGTRFQQPSNIRIPGTNGMMSLIKTQQNHGLVRPQQVPGGMPIITNSMSLRQLKPKPASQIVPVLNPKYGGQIASRASAPRQLATFIPQTSSPSPALSTQAAPQPQVSRPVQVRTVFVPPPMKMKAGSCAVSPSSAASPAPKVINSFNLSLQGSVPLASGISITPISKSNGTAAPVIKGVNASNGVSSKVVDEAYDDIELDDDDEGADNELQIVASKKPNVSESSPIITNVQSVIDSPKPQVDFSNQKAKKSFKNTPGPDQFTITISPKKNESEKKLVSNDLLITTKRPLGISEAGNSELSKRLRADDSSIISIPKPSIINNRKPVPSLAPAQDPSSSASSSLVSQLPGSCQGQIIKDAILETDYTCQAIENVGGHRVGCKNTVKRVELVKLTTKDRAVLCDLHRDRLASYGCCPLCGEFCSHGLVFMCRASKTTSPHLFHRSCYTLKNKEERMCPHCGSRRIPMAVQLKMSMSKTPLKLLNYTAKMTGAKPREVSELWQTDKLRENVLHYTLPNGKVISSEGLPKGLDSNKLEDLLKTFNSKNSAKVTTRNMYIPTAAGDNVKLLQLLALDYSPSQKFPEVDGGSPLHVAAANNHPLTAHILMQAGADIDAFDDNNETPLMIAAYNGLPNIVRYFITAGAKVELKSDDGMTALHLAAQNGHLECCHIILGANNLPRAHINVKDDGGWTPLVWACEHKHEAVIRYLLDQGADPFTTDVEMNIALHWAAFSGDENIVELLLSAGSDVNMANAIGETPLHIALRQDHYECALYLITRGSRLDLANNQGQLPAHCLDGANSRAASLIQLGTTLHKLMAERKAKFLPEKKVSPDISNGKEAIPITAINGEDLELGPSGYVYVKNNVITNPLPIERNISKLQHCKCKDNCSSEETCKCSEISLRSWYDSNSILKEGFDFSDPPMIFECNDMCGCNINSCNNRVVQHGITARTQVYKTYGMGWGVKALVDIPKGGFVCEYVGEIISDAEAEQRENDSYLFDLENRDGDTFCIDANKFGNVTRFINHSCDPNLTPVKVFTSHQDLRFPHIAMFASREIKKGDILGFDYGEKFWVIKHKYFTCWCGLEKCKYSKTAIGRTLDSYYKKNGLSRSEEEEEDKKQTGRLKLKLKMEEGKVVKVDDSQLLPDEPEKRKIDRRYSSEIEKSRDKSENGSSDSRKAKKNGHTDLKKIIQCKEKVRDELDSSDSDASKKSDRSIKKKEKSKEKKKALIDLKVKIDEIQGQIKEIKTKKNGHTSKENSVEKSDSINNSMDIEENNIENLVQNTEDVMDEIAEEDREMSSYHNKMDIAREVIDSLINDIDIKSIEAIKLIKKSRSDDVAKPRENIGPCPKILNNNENETLQTANTEPIVKENQCPKCLITINKILKLKKHSRLCKGKKMSQLKPVNVKLETSSPEKHIVTIKNIDENAVDNVKDTKEVEEIKNEEEIEDSSSLDSNSNTDSINAEETPRRRGRPKKPMVDVNNIMENLPPSANYLKRSSRSSSSLLTPDPATETMEAETETSGRPKRTRKAVDKDL